MYLELFNIEYFSWYGYKYTHMWTNSISITDGTGAFSVTPTMMRALYTYYASLGATAVGTCTNYTLGAPA